MGKANRSEYSFIQSGPLQFASVEIVKRMASGNAIAVLLESVNVIGNDTIEHFPKGSRIVLLPGEY